MQGLSSRPATSQWYGISVGGRIKKSKLRYGRFGRILRFLWPSYRPNLGYMTIIGHSFHGDYSLAFGSIMVKLCREDQPTIFYRLVMRTPSYDAYFQILIFGPLGTFSWKMDVANTLLLKVQGFNPTQKVDLMDLISKFWFLFPEVIPLPP